MCIHQQIMSLRKLHKFFILRDTKKICFTAVEVFAGGISYRLSLN